jgi:hypothetical protein
MIAQMKIQHSSLEAEFLHHVWQALRGDHSDLRREQIILNAYRSAVSQALMEIRLLPEHGEVNDFNRGYNAAIRRAHDAVERALKPRSSDEGNPVSRTGETANEGGQMK